MTPKRLFVAGLLLAAIALALMVVAPADALRAWLAAMFLWSGVPVGSLGFLMIVRVVGGRWGHGLSLPFEAGALTLPIIAAALLPLLLGMAVLYPWVGAGGSGFRAAWLSPPWFALRSLLLLAGLGIASWALVRRRGPAVSVSSAGLLFLIPMMSIVAVDWLVSLDAGFHSSGFGLYALSIQFTVALMTAMWMLLGRQPDRTATLGALSITMILIWLYLAFTSYFIIWSGDLATVVGWYQQRGRGSWGVAIGISAVIESAAFLVLLLTKARHSARGLRALAAVIVFGKAIEAAWLVLPQGGEMRIGAVAMVALASAALGLIVVQAQQYLFDRRLAERTPE